MKYLKIREDFIKEAFLSKHYEERYILRIENLKIVDKDGDYPIDKAVQRIKILLKEKCLNLIEKHKGTKEDESLIINIGDIKIKHNNKISSPVFSVQGENSNKTYNGSVYVAILIGDNASTIELFDRNVDKEDIKKQVFSHVKKSRNLRHIKHIKHEYLDDLVNIIDVDISLSDYIDVIKKNEITIKNKSFIKVSKEMVFVPGTIIKYYKNKELIEKIVNRTERFITKNEIRIYFTDGTFKTFKKDDRFIVTPAKNTKLDKKIMKDLNTEGENFIGSIYTIGTYSKEKYKGKGAALGGAADYVRIYATSSF